MILSLLNVHVLVWAIKICTNKYWDESFLSLWFYCIFENSLKFRGACFDCKDTSRNHCLHLQFRGNNTPPNYVIDYGFPLQTWKEVNSLLLATFNNQLFRCDKKKKKKNLILAINAWSRCRMTSKVQKNIACQSCLFQKNKSISNFVSKWNRVHERTFANSLQMLSLFQASQSSWLLSHDITRWIWMEACWPYRTPRLKLRVNNY